MSGLSTGASLAEQLRYLADEKNRVKNMHPDFSPVYGLILKLAGEHAKEGRYQVTIFDSRFSSNKLMEQLIPALKEQNFVVEIDRRSNVPSYITVKWK